MELDLELGLMELNLELDLVELDLVKLDSSLPLEVFSGALGDDTGSAPSAV